MSNLPQTAAKALLQIGVLVAIFAAGLFLAAGSIQWPMGWVFLAVVAAGQIIAAAYLAQRNPELLAERASNRGKRDSDRVLAGVMAFFGPLAMCIVAGLQWRNGWTPQIGIALQIIGVALGILGSLITVWAMASNRFFYGILRIAPERGHQVCSSGPYQFIRHPGYLGAILFDLATPLILGALWAFIPALLAAAAIVMRTAGEDRALRQQLEGYGAYAQRVRSRILPGIW